ncbi:MAG: hypothetical protein WEB90_05165 [Gemmatimonadota bacterium]
MDPALFERMQEAARRFRAGESDREEIMTPNGLAVLQRDANDPSGFRIDFVGEGARRSVSLQEYPALPSRPPGYPAPLPFLESCRATVNTLDQVVTWHDVRHPDAAFESVCRQVTADGWTPHDPGAGHGGKRLPMRCTGTRSFEKDGVRRTLVLVSDDGPPHIVLSEQRLPTHG